MKRFRLGLIALVSLVPVSTHAQKDYTAHEAVSTGRVSVMGTGTNMMSSTLGVAAFPFGVAVTPDGSKVYLTHIGANIVSVIDTTTNTVIGSPIHVGFLPYGLAATPDGSKVFAANHGARDNSVSVIDTAAKTVSATIPVCSPPTGAAVTPAGSPIYIAS